MAGSFGICEPGQPVVPALERLHGEMTRKVEDMPQFEVVTPEPIGMGAFIVLNGKLVPVKVHPHIELTCIYMLPPGGRAG